MRVSVVMPCYNASRHLAQALDSLRAQTWTDFEVVAVDDGSTDGTAAMLDEYAARHRWLKVVHQANSGRPAIARNAGIDHAVGDVVCFLDADDVWDPEKLREVVGAFDRRPNLAVIFHDYRLIADTGSILAPSARAARIDEAGLEAAWELESAGSALFLARPSTYAHFLSGPIIMHTSAVAIDRRRAGDFDLRFDSSLTCSEDIDLWLRCVARLRCAFLDRVLGSYRDAEGSITKRRALVNADGARLYERHFERPLMPLSADTRRALRRRIAGDHFDTAYCLAAERKWRPALATYVRSLSWRPALRTVMAIVKLFLRAARSKLGAGRADRN